MRTTASGIILPNEASDVVTVPCGFCGAGIQKQNEARGRLYLFENKPICAKCRIMKGSRFANKIKASRMAYEKDVAEKERREQVKANEQAIEIAIESQKKSDAQRSS